MIESEGITESVTHWKLMLQQRSLIIWVLKTLCLKPLITVFEWYIKNYGPEINLFVDHSQIVQLECLRSGLWALKALGVVS